MGWRVGGVIIRDIGSAAGIIIGRGGLGLEARLEELPHLQKYVIGQCIASHARRTVPRSVCGK